MLTACRTPLDLLSPCSLALPRLLRQYFFKKKLEVVGPENINNGCKINCKTCLAYFKRHLIILVPSAEVKREKNVHLSLGPQQQRIRRVKHEPTVNQVDALCLNSASQLVSGVSCIFRCNVPKIQSIFCRRMGDGRVTAARPGVQTRKRGESHMADTGTEREIMHESRQLCLNQVDIISKPNFSFIVIIIYLPY